ncbi:MAG: hypothetical protein U5K69_06680 [Balneolaceae bacterium]|nr:hypothetical protein [Balneolaceae bacterium]
MDAATSPFGPDNYPYEIEEDPADDMRSVIRRYGGLPKGKRWTWTLPMPLPWNFLKVETNYGDEDYGRGDTRYLYGEEALKTFDMASGYEIELFASEREFDDLANPVQLSFDNQGRLWVAVMPSYPHWKPGDGKPNDKLLDSGRYRWGRASRHTDNVCRQPAPAGGI